MEPQQSDAQAHDPDQLDGGSSLKPDDQQQQPQDAAGVDFDSASFASLLQNQLIAYTFSWGPLKQALESLAASMGKQQRHQKDNNDAIKEMRQQLNEMQDKIHKSDQDKQEMATAVEQLQDKVAGLQTELESSKQQMDKLQKDHHEQAQTQAQAEAQARQQDEAATNGPTASSPSAALSPGDGGAVFATADDLKTVKQALTNQLRKSLSAVFGEQFVVNDGEEEDAEAAQIATINEDNDNANDGSSSSAGESTASSGEHLQGPASRPGTGVSGVLRTPLPGVPFASEAMVRAELAALRDLHASMDAKMASQKQQAKALEERVDGHDAQLEALQQQLQQQQQQQQRRNSIPQDTGGSVQPVVATGPSGDVLQKQIQDLQAQQDALRRQLDGQQGAVDKQASGMKELAATLDDMAMQQALYRSAAAPAPAATGSSDSNKTGRKSSNSGDASGQPQQLDLSLVFTKIAELRRATDASVDQIQQSVQQNAATTASQQAQLDALRNAAVFHDLQKIKSLETKLSLQKELLERNQTHQDRTKPQLAEWKKQLETTEDKLLQGICDQDTLDEIQQLQNKFHRTMLTMSPLINSPLTIAESLQKLSEEIKSLQGGVQAGIIPLALENRISSSTPRQGNESTTKHQRVEEFATKLRYLDEEVSATNQVNVVTEKKNDPLLKSLDAMRDKLDRLGVLWHQNWATKKSLASGASGANGPSPRVPSPSVRLAPAPAPSSAVGADALKDVEMKLLSAVRRINSLEEEVDRLGALSSSTMLGSSTTTSSQQQQQRAKADAEDALANLRKEMLDEIQRLAKALAGLQAMSGGVRSPSPSSNTGRGSSDLVSDLHAQMVQRSGGDLDSRFQSGSSGGEDAEGGAHGQRATMYDALLKDLTKKVTQSVVHHLEKNGGGATGAGTRATAASAGIGANPNVNFRALLENFTHKFEDKLDDSHEFTVEELAKLRKEILDLLKSKLEAAVRELRSEFQLIYYSSASGGDGNANSNGDSTAVGTKPVMCVACSRPVPVSGMVRDAGTTYPSAEMIAEQTNALLHAELEYDRNDEEFVYRAGFKMPADRKTMTLPFLATNIRNRIALNKIDRKPRRPVRHNGNPVDSVVREAMELDRKQRYHHHGGSQHPPSPPK